MRFCLVFFFFRLYQTDGRIVHHESSAPSGLGLDTDGVTKYFIVDRRQISDDRPKSCCNVVTSFATFFFVRKVGCALANTMLAIVIILHTVPIVFARSTGYYPPGKQKQKKSLAKFLRRLSSVRFLHVVQKVRSVQSCRLILRIWSCGV